jgi:hypothetical protein
MPKENTGFRHGGPVRLKVMAVLKQSFVKLTQNTEACSSLDLRRLATSAQNAQPASICASAVPEATHGTPLAVAIVSPLLFLSFSLSLSLLLFPSFSRSLYLCSRLRHFLCLPVFRPFPFRSLSPSSPLLPPVPSLPSSPLSPLLAFFLSFSTAFSSFSH